MTSHPVPGRSLPPAFEHKVVQILVRWLLIILAFHFVALSRVSPVELVWAVRISYLFALSNLLLMAVPRRYFSPGLFSRVVMAADLVFVAASLYFVRESGSEYHWLLILSLVLFTWRRDVWLVLVVLALGLPAVSLFVRMTAGSWVVFSDAGDFLRSAILFVVGLLYFFLLELLNRNATLFLLVARAKQEWERTADAMSELILLLDGEGRIRRVNRALAERLGKSPSDLIGKLWHAALEGSEQPRADSPLARMFASRAPIDARYGHGALGGEMEVSAVPVFEGDSLVEAVYVLRP